MKENPMQLPLELAFNWYTIEEWRNRTECQMNLCWFSEFIDVANKIVCDTFENREIVYSSRILYRHRLLEIAEYWFYRGILYFN